MTIENTLRALGDNPTFVAARDLIQPGYFERDPESEVYNARLVYTKELRRFVYDMAAMNEILSESELKELFFRTFGYKGSLDFTLYPSAWLRDLPLVDIGAGSYLGDGILLGTNQVSRDQKNIKVGSIKIGERCIFDQRCVVGLDTTIGNDCIIGIQSAIGLWCRLGDNVTLNAQASVSHKVTIGEGATIGYVASVLNGATVEPGVYVPDGFVVPQGATYTANGLVMPEPRS